MIKAYDLCGYIGSERCKLATEQNCYICTRAMSITSSVHVCLYRNNWPNIQEGSNMDTSMSTFSHQPVAADKLQCILCTDLMWDCLSGTFTFQLPSSDGTVHSPHHLSSLTS